ncbi:MAG TPA: sulfocyanin-like copper-binding protein [Marmoricola sp.]|nr:sulfocyanin-like copper-binding protein [Marmoricola sp.]
MNYTARLAASLGAALALAFISSASLAATVVDVTLWDKGAAMPMGTGMTYGTMGVDMSTATMGIKAAPATAKAGVVTFHVTNSSKDTIHEMIVMFLADPTKPLPYIDAEQRVDEDKAGDKGEVSELDPGASGSLTVALKPGSYLLICNVPGHYAAGMWTQFEVTK